MIVRRGMTLIDVVVGTALILIIFVALFGLLRASVVVSGEVKSEATANAIADSQMEYIRSLPYDSVGIVGGIPTGTIPEYATTTEDGVGYGVRTFIDYYDDPADGVGVNDTNGITTDYKRIKITVSYNLNHIIKTITLDSNYAPPGIETTNGGGTLQIDVVNASGMPVPGATVQITNSSTNPTINLTAFSDTNGMVSLPGATSSSQYDVVVSKSGYSSAATYPATPTNQNPNPGYLTVANEQTTTGTFAIDALSTVTLQTYSPITNGAFWDTFADSSKLASLQNTTAGGGSLTLNSSSTSGTALSITTAPQYLASWGTASSTIGTPGGTSAMFQVVDASGALIPDSVLPGNSTGFTSSVNLSGLSTTTYPALALEATLQSSTAGITPSFSNWGLSYQSGPLPLPNVGFTVTGAKTIGTTGAGVPIYKTVVSGATNASGTDILSLEWDSYSLTLTSSYDVVDACTPPPFAISPGTNVTESLYLGAPTSNAILINVTDGSGNVVPGAMVTLSRSGYSQSATSTACGNAYFGNLTPASDYSITISKAGYTSNTTPGVAVSGMTFYDVSF